MSYDGAQISPRQQCLFIHRPCGCSEMEMLLPAPSLCPTVAALMNHSIDSWRLLQSSNRMTSHSLCRLLRAQHLSIKSSMCWLTGSFPLLLPRELQWTFMNNLEELWAGLYPPAVPPALGKVWGEANTTMHLSSRAKGAAAPPSLNKTKQTSALTPSLSSFLLLLLQYVMEGIKHKISSWFEIHLTHFILEYLAGQLNPSVYSELTWRVSKRLQVKDEIAQALSKGMGILVALSVPCHSFKLLGFRKWSDTRGFRDELFILSEKEKKKKQQQKKSIGVTKLQIPGGESWMACQI